MISVIMPVFNETINILEKSIQSIFNQSHKEFELIIISDNPLNHGLNRYLRSLNDERLKLIFNQNNSGVAESRKIGASVAKGQYICFNDGDDFSLPDRLKLSKAIMDSDLTVDLITGNSDLKIRFNKAFTVDNLIFLKNFLSNPTVFFRASVLQKVPLPVGLNRSEDYDFYLRMVKNGMRILYLPINLAVYNFNLDGLSKSNHYKSYVFHEFVKENYLGFDGSYNFEIDIYYNKITNRGLEENFNMLYSMFKFGFRNFDFSLIKSKFTKYSLLKITKLYLTEISLKIRVIFKRGYKVDV